MTQEFEGFQKVTNDEDDVCCLSDMSLVILTCEQFSNTNN